MKLYVLHSKKLSVPQYCVYSVLARESYLASKDQRDARPKSARCLAKVLNVDCYKTIGPALKYLAGLGLVTETDIGWLACPDSGQHFYTRATNKGHWYTKLAYTVTELDPDKTLKANIVAAKAGSNHSISRLTKISRRTVGRYQPKTSEIQAPKSFEAPLSDAFTVKMRELCDDLELDQAQRKEIATKTWKQIAAINKYTDSASSTRKIFCTLFNYGKRLQTTEYKWQYLLLYFFLDKIPEVLNDVKKDRIPEAAIITVGKACLDQIFKGNLDPYKDKPHLAGWRFTKKRNTLPKIDPGRFVEDSNRGPYYVAGVDG